MFANASLIQKQSFFCAVLNSVGLTLECLLVWIFFSYQNICFTIPSTETTKGVKVARLVSTASGYFFFSCSAVSKTVSTCRLQFLDWSSRRMHLPYTLVLHAGVIGTFPIYKCYKVCVLYENGGAKNIIGAVN